jgi:hypothetical protein
MTPGSTLKVVTLLGVLAAVGGCPALAKRESSPVRLNADVKFTGTQFTIRNPSAVDWTNGKAEINCEYEYRFGTLPAGRIVEIGAMQFASANGEPFAPFHMQPVNVVVAVDLPDDRGMWQGGWR